jgi:hypothetical protein
MAACAPSIHVFLGRPLSFSPVVSNNILDLQDVALFCVAGHVYQFGLQGSGVYLHVQNPVSHR